MIRHHGVGLSVDLYTPDLIELVAALTAAGGSADYLEIFRARATDLAAIGRRLPAELRLAYHADGLWFCQPEFQRAYPWEAQVERVRRDTALLDSDWATHECASKQMVGYSFGTYLPPILSEASAAVTARHAQAVQDRLGERPLLLIELPPFYYFVPGTYDLAAFFAQIAESCDCGLLFDIGHLYTYYLYSERGRRIAPDDFFAAFLDRFPLERVVQVHLAGLALGQPYRGGQALLDDHGAPVPSMLFDWLARLLASPRLISLRGVALEVDTKETPLILEEYRRFRAVAADWATRFEATAS